MAKKTIDNACVNFKKIHVYGCILLFPTHFSPEINHFGGFVIVKDKLTSSIRGQVNKKQTSVCQLYHDIMTRRFRVSIKSQATPKIKLISSIVNKKVSSDIVNISLLQRQNIWKQICTILF